MTDETSKRMLEFQRTMGYIKKNYPDVSAQLLDDLEYREFGGDLIPHNPKKSSRRVAYRYFFHMLRLKSEILYTWDHNMGVAYSQLPDDIFKLEDIFEDEGRVDILLDRINIGLDQFRGAMGLTKEDLNFLEEWYD